MITPDYLTDVMSECENALSVVNENIIRTLAKRLEVTITKYGKNDLIPTSLNQILNLEESGMTYAEIEREVEKALPGIQAEVREAFAKGASKMDEYYGGGVRKLYDDSEEKKPEEQTPPAPPVPTPPIVPPSTPSPIDTEIKPDSPEYIEPRKHKEPKKRNYPDFIAHTGYGQMLGLCGINCRHTFSICFPDSDTKDDRINKAQNAKKYRLEQEARAKERKIRALKQQLAAYNGASEDIFTEQDRAALVDKINDLIDSYKDFCKKHKISMAEWRLATVGSVAHTNPKRSKARAKANAKNMSPMMKKQLENVYKQTNGTIRNICKTTAASTQTTFINACDNAFLKIRAGKSPNEAIREAISEVAKQGATCVYYNSKKTDKIEVALARAIRTGINQANAQLILMKCAELGIDYVKVSSHYGARVTKQNDYTNHSWWQGKIYKLNWDDEALAKFKNDAETEEPENEPGNKPEETPEPPNRRDKVNRKRADSYDKKHRRPKRRKKGKYAQNMNNNAQNGAKNEQYKGYNAQNNTDNVRLNEESRQKLENKANGIFQKYIENGNIEIDKKQIKPVESMSVDECMTYIGKPILMKDNIEVRKWYAANIQCIPQIVANIDDMFERAYLAYELRKVMKHYARLQMTDKEKVMVLESMYPVISFEDLIKHKIKDKGLKGNAIYEDIVITSGKSNENVNKELLGL